MARRTYKSNKSRKKSKMQRTFGVKSTRVTLSGLILGLATALAFAAIVLDDWVDWGVESVSVSLWSYCEDIDFGFRECVNLRNSDEHDTLGDAGLASLLMLISALVVGVLGTGVTFLFGYGKNIGFFCLPAKYNAFMAFVFTSCFAIFSTLAWVLYSAIYFSSTSYKDSDPSQTPGAAYYLAVAASVLGIMAWIISIFNWALDYRKFSDDVYKKSLLTAILTLFGLMFTLLALGTRSWVRSPSHLPYLGSANVTGRLEGGLFELCITHGASSSCTSLDNSHSDELKEEDMLDFDLNLLFTAGLTTGFFYLLAVIVMSISAFLSLVHAFRWDVGFLCCHRRYNGYVSMLLCALAGFFTCLAWLTYVTMVYGDDDYKSNGDLVAGYSVGFAIAAFGFSIGAFILSFFARLNPAWYASDYESSDEESSLSSDVDTSELTATRYDDDSDDSDDDSDDDDSDDSDDDDDDSDDSDDAPKGKSKRGGSSSKKGGSSSKKGGSSSKKGGSSKKGSKKGGSSKKGSKKGSKKRGKKRK